MELQESSINFPGSFETYKKVTKLDGYPLRYIIFDGARMQINTINQINTVDIWQSFFAFLKYFIKLPITNNQLKGKNIFFVLEKALETHYFQQT